MARRPKKRTNPWRVFLLLILIGITFYLNQVVAPATPALFVPTPTVTRSPESFVNEAEQYFAQGKLSQAITSYENAIASDPNNPACHHSRVVFFGAPGRAHLLGGESSLLVLPLFLASRCMISSHPSQVLAPLSAVNCTVWVEQDCRLTDCPNLRNPFFYFERKSFSQAALPEQMLLDTFRGDYLDFYLEFS